MAIPTLDAGPGFVRSLEAVRSQRLDGGFELLVCDSGSSDGTPALARAHGAEVIEIPRENFSHGGTRNLLMQRARGAYVAFLTQDSVPASDTWLQTLVNGFGLAPRVGLAFGPYWPQPAASPSVKRELTEWFRSFSPDGAPRVDCLPDRERALPTRELFGHRGYFTNANGCVSRQAWREIPFRPVAYAEDHLLAHDMLRAGFAKVFLPQAAVVHSHEYSPWQWLRRSFDEARAIAEIYGFSELGEPGTAARNFRGSVGADWRYIRASEGPDSPLARREQSAALAASALHHGVRAAGAMLGVRADRLPPRLVARLSLENRR